MEKVIKGQQDDRMKRLIGALKSATQVYVYFPEKGQHIADEALLEYVNNPEVTRLFYLTRKL